MSSMPCVRFMRRARARMSETSSALVSSMKIGASRRALAADIRRWLASMRSSRAMSPRWRRHVFTPARPASMRLASDSVLISREKMSTGCFLPLSQRVGMPLMSCPIATHSAMFMAREVLPTDGRAATTIMSPPLRPISFSSRYLKPVERPSNCPAPPSKRRSMALSVFSTAIFQSMRTLLAPPISRKLFSTSPRRMSAFAACDSSMQRRSVSRARWIIVRRRCFWRTMSM